MTNECEFCGLRESGGNLRVEFVSNGIVVVCHDCFNADVDPQPDCDCAWHSDPTPREWAEQLRDMLEMAADDAAHAKRERMEE